ncbi:hypothetical protein MMAD_55310 (plasmid) [Mycolicibacterium madagascariense]|uniref:FAS1-like dehydratase domain-containing protein n=1 Tax=Mycolicibacterium madagascariense TaxID=212765 RepID=A0A7I7XPS8_9MYCO|nr:MaoC/PaaZ C-terminal domain-containing protein [Mycolicibacterium madagascariense]BBZ31236.1 hypothetical protein MMAD_55310 [Mycolicibacterium madagascariense]
MSVANDDTYELSDLVETWRPGPVAVEDSIIAEPARRLGATLDLDDAFVDGAALPLLWHWLYFPSWPATSQLGPDGHPTDGHFMPPMPQRRRMFAGGRLEIKAPMVIGERTQRLSELASAVVKHGRSGEMLFVTIRQTFRQGGTVVLEEERDLVYRSESERSSAFARASAGATAPPAAWHHTPHIDATVLFRFSALTSNAHRIHYDQRYAGAEEGFPDLVVHGPLLAIYMANLVHASEHERIPASFDFRLRRPVFLGDRVTVQGTPVAGGAELAVVSGQDTIHASATVTYR